MKFFSLLVVVLLFFGCTKPIASKVDNQTPVVQPTEPIPPEPQPSVPEPNVTAPLPQVPNLTQNVTPTPPPPIPEPQPSIPQIPSTPQPPTKPNITYKEIFYNSGPWKIYGTLYPAQKQAPTHAIILIHELGSDRSSYPIEFIKRLHDEIPDALVLAIDLRGNGESTNAGSWTYFSTEDYRDMKTDLISAQNYFGTNYPSVKDYYYVGSSIGSTAAILASAQVKTAIKLAMISPGMNYQNVSISSVVKNYDHDLLLISSSGDAYSAQSLSQIQFAKDSPQVQTKIYPGSAHGTALFNDTVNYGESLASDLVNFLKN